MMKINQVLDGSIIVLLFKTYFKWYDRIMRKALEIFRNSRIYKMAMGCWKCTETCIRNSFFWKIVEARQTSYGVLDNSQIIFQSVRFYKWCRKNVTDCVKISFIFGLLKALKEKLYSSPGRSISIYLIAAIVANIIISTIFLQKNISLYGWFVRIFFLVIGFNELFCGKNWIRIKKGSMLLKFLYRLT